MKCTRMQPIESELSSAKVGTHQVHTITSTGNQASVRQSVHCRQLLERYRLVHEVNRHKLDRTEATVDAAYELVDGRAQVLVLLDVLTGRNGELNENDLPDPFGVLSEEDFESVELLRDTLDVVETVNADDDFAAFESLAKGGDTRSHRFTLEALGVSWTSAVNVPLRIVRVRYQ